MFICHHTSTALTLYIFYQSGIKHLAVLMKTANRGRCVLVYLGFSHSVLMLILLKQEQHGSLFLFDSVPASWSLGETKAVWDIWGWEGGGGPQSTRAEAGLIEEGEGVSTVGVIWGLHEETNPDPPCGFCSKDGPVDRENEADRDER